MLPYLNWGSWHISSYALCYATMYGLIGLYSFKRLRRLPVAPHLLARIVLLFLLGVFIGSQVNVIATSIRYWAISGVWLRAGHISALWGLIVGFGTGVWALLRWGGPLGRGLDLGGLPVPLGQAIGRLGCLAAGCCGGAAASAGWGLPMPDEYGNWLNRYPTQPICAVFDVLIFLVLLALDRQPVGSRFRPFDGSLLATYVLLFSAKRFAIEFFRADYQPVMGPFSVVHLATMLMFGGALCVWLFRTSQGGLRVSSKTV
jgi:phosphatidylglycerol---prolipoprotein diacylglyceryl transferase